LTKAKQAETVIESTALLSRLEKLISRCETIFDKAMEDEQWTSAAAAAREIRGALEILGKLSGELQNGAKVAINFGDITKIDIRTLTDDQLEALCARMDHPPPGLMTNEEIDAELYEIAFRYGYAKSAVKDSPLFDEETVAAPMGGNHVCWHIPGKWIPYRKSSPADRFRMLQVAWKKITGLELSDKLRMQDLGAQPTITIGFDFADTREENWHTWPKVELLVGKSSDETAAAPAKIIQGVR
jgi:hypothetical protein